VILKRVELPSHASFEIVAVQLPLQLGTIIIWGRVAKVLLNQYASARQPLPGA
jgi:hypothetical protein